MTSHDHLSGERLRSSDDVVTCDAAVVEAHVSSQDSLAPCGKKRASRARVTSTAGFARREMKGQTRLWRVASGAAGELR